MTRRFGACAALLAVALLAGRFAVAAESGVALTPETARFQRHSVPEGLPQATVRAIVEDEHGFLWLGTQDGLARFDGYDTRVFVREPGVSSSLVNSQVTALAIVDGALWVGTQGGLGRYDEALERFDNFRNDPGDGASLASDLIYALLVGHDGMLWVGTNGGVSRWRAATRDFESLLADVNLPVFALTQDRSGRVWLGTTDGLRSVDPKTGAVDATPLAAEATAVLRGVPIRSLLVDRNERLWIGTDGEGLFRYDPASTMLQRLGGNAEAPVSGRIHALFEDSDGRLWAGTEIGLDVCAAPERQDPAWVHFAHRRHDPYGLGSGRITAIAQGRDATLWFGSWTGGLTWLSPDSGRFSSFGPDVAATAGLRDASIQGVRAEEPSTLWLGSRDGLYRFDVTANRLELVAGSEGLHIAELELDADTVWLGTNRGVARMSRRGGPIEPLSIEPTFDLGRIVALRPDGARLWVGTQAPGLAIVDPGGSEPPRLFPMSNVRVIAPYDDERMLVGSASGLHWFTRTDARLLRHLQAQPQRPGALPFDFVTAFLRASDGRTWLGTQGGGLLHMELDSGADPESARFRSYTRADGLGADAIGRIVEDRDGRLWMSTTHGISRFDPDTGKFDNYAGGDGAFDTGYYIGSGTRLASGWIAFGGLDGFTIFNPDRLSAAPPPPRVLLTELRIGARAVGVQPSDAASPLKQALHIGDTLRLPPDDARGFSVRFAAPYPAAPQQLRFAHRLDGFDEDWVESDSRQRQVTYTNLGPGDYRLRVKATNRDRVWSPTETTLGIAVLPRWWQTLWARAGFVLFCAAALYGGFRWRVRAIADQRQRLQQRVEARTADLVTLGEIGRELTATLEPEETFQLLYRRIAPLLDAHVFSIGIYDAQAQVVRSDFAIEGGELLPPRVFPMSERNRPAVWCVTQRRELVTTSRRQLTDYVEAILPVSRGAAMESIVYLPLVAHDVMLGCLSVQSPQQNAYTGAQLDFLRTLASYTAIAISNAQTFRQLREAMERLQRTQEQLLLNEKLAATGQLTAGVAHEINNPTNFAYVAAQNLEQKLAQFHAFLRDLAGPDAEPEILTAIDGRVSELDEQLATIIEGNRRVRGIVQDLRAFSRLDEAERKRVPVAATLRSTLALIGTTYQRDVRIDTHLDDDPQIDCLPARLNQVFMNIVVNACHAIAARRRLDPTAPEGLLTICCAATDGEVRIDFQDNGIGMDEATRKHIFEPFFTTKAVGEGSGLGLSVSYGIVRDHGGRIDVDSVPGTGSRFTVVLPLPAAIAVGA